MIPIDGEWNCVERLDAHDIEVDGRVQCEFCRTAIRWIHVLVHDEVAERRFAGCCCAARLCEGYNAEESERAFKNKCDRRVRFVDLSRWTVSRTNPTNIFREMRLPSGRVRVVIFLKDGRYGVVISDLKKGSPTFSPGRYSTRAEALVMAFELFESMKGEQ